jgi:hypothetical protein
MLESLFRSAIPWWAWPIVGLVPPLIVALYFLKLRRHPLEVPSTFLWKKSIEDLHVNSLWQRLRKSVLLLLQLLLVALALLALLRPGWQGTNLAGDRYIFMIDNSASMGATDVAGAEHRLARAKQQVNDLIDQMDGTSSAMLLTFGGEPRVEQEFTQNKRKLRDKLAAIDVKPSSTDIRAALELARGLAVPSRTLESTSDDEVDPASEGATAYIFSDGRFAAVDDFVLGGLSPVYLPIGEAQVANLAITAFSTRRAEGLAEGRQAFVQVTNYDQAEHEVEVELELNGSFVDAKRVAVPPGDSRGVTFALAATATGKLQAKLSDKSLEAAGDKLAIDNQAYAALNERDGGRVLVVSPGNPVLRIAFETDRAQRLADIEFAEPAVLGTQAHQELADGGVYDLIIYDQCQPAEGRMPRSNTLFVGEVPPTLAWRPVAANQPEAGAESPATLGELSRVAAPQVIDWAREHPLLASVELGNLAIVGSYAIVAPRGGTNLIDSTQGVIAAIGPREGYEDAVLGFAILKNEAGSQMVNTNWYNRHSFPTFWLNTLDYFVNQSQGGESSSYVPGQPVEFRSRSRAAQVTVRAPDGSTSQVARNSQQRYAFQQALLPGVYEVLDQGQVTERFAVNLFDGQESDIGLRTQASDNTEDNVREIADIKIGYNEVAATTVPARQEIWRPLLLLALGVLLLEWYVYNKRVYL